MPAEPLLLPEPEGVDEVVSALLAEVLLGLDVLLVRHAEFAAFLGEPEFA